MKSFVSNRSGPQRAHARSAWLLPNATLALFVVGIVALLWFVHRHESEILLSTLRQDTQYAELAISRKFQVHQAFVDRLAGQVGLGLAPDTLIDQADDYVLQNPEVLNVLWTRESGDLDFATPSHKDLFQLIRERPPVAEIERMQRLTNAMRRATYTEPYTDYQNEPLIEYHGPVFDKGRFLGTISMSISLRSAVTLLIPPGLAQKHRFSLADADNQELTLLDTESEIHEPLTQSVVLTLPWRNLRLTATSYKTDSLIGHAVLVGVTLLLTALLLGSLWSLRARVSRQAAADSALAASHERFGTVLDALDAAVVVSDFDTRELLFTNESFERLFPGFALGQSASELEMTLKPVPSQAITRETLIDAAGQPTGVHKVEVQDAARGLWYLVRVRAVRWVDGRMVRLSMLGDISDRKAADERSRVQQEKLLLTSRLMSVGEMASTLAHEINQPLAAIANYNMGAVRRLKSDQWKKEELVMALEKSAAQAERAGRVVQRVREFLRRREPVREAASINEIITDVTELIELEAEKSRVFLKLELDPALPQVHADRIMMEQVLLNLIKNAIDSMKLTDAGERRLLVQTLRLEAQAEVRVTDRGHGIAPDVEAELFSPFFTTKENGMGMGLNICRSIVEMHEGHLWFSRNPGGGSVFHFTLPFAAATRVLEQ